MSFVLAAAIAAVSAIPMLPVPDDFALVIGAQMPSARVFEWSGYGGEKSHAKARITFEDARNNCSAFKADASHEYLEGCAEAAADGRVWEMTANCHTGDLWTDGGHYRFDGPYKEGFYAGYVSMKDMKTGKKVGWDSASGGVSLGTNYRILCPMVTPYDIIPYSRNFTLSADDSLFGEIMGHNGSVMFHPQGKHIIVYSAPKDSIAGTIKENTVLFRGWVVPGQWIAGIAFTFKKGCEPAPYHVEGRLDNSYETPYPSMILRGRSPVRDGCKVVGYTDKSPNAKLEFQLPEH